jgi:hypothetical protein
MAMNHPWDAEQIERLKALSRSGASLLRAAAVLGRQQLVVQTKARELGFPLVGLRESKRLRKARCADAEAKLRRVGS